MDGLKQRIAESVERLGDELNALSQRIHAHPELAFEETRACGWLAEFLDQQGFRVETGVGGVATAFRASLDTGAHDRDPLRVRCPARCWPRLRPQRHRRGRGRRGRRAHGRA